MRYTLKGLAVRPLPHRWVVDMCQRYFDMEYILKHAFAITTCALLPAAGFAFSLEV